MCLAVPMQVTEIKGDKAQISSADHAHWVRIDLLKDVKTGDWLLAHGSLAIQKVDKKTALEMLKLQNEMNNV